MSESGVAGCNRSRLMARLGVVLGVAALALALLPAGRAAANVNLAFPEETPGPPYYLRGIEPASEAVEWVPIVFYRDPSCVPADFNLLNFFDAPRAFGCPLTVEGFEIWRNGPGQDTAPLQVKSRGLGAVPVWFVSAAEHEAAIADGVLTITELRALPSLLMGTAERYHEVLHPGEEAGRRARLTITASGSLSDGRSFRLQVSGNPAQPQVRHVKITFR